VAKNKGKYRAAREAAEAAPANEELVTLTSRVTKALRPHAFKILAVLVGVLIMLTAVGTWNWLQKRRATNATRDFGKAMETMHADVTDTPDPTPPKKDAPPKFTTNKDRSEATLAILQKLDKSYAKTGVGKAARLVEAGTLYDLGRYDEAISAYQEFLKSAPKNELQVIGREGLGYAQEAKALAQTDALAQEAGLKEALKTFEAMQPDDKGQGRDLALFHQGRVQAELKQKDKAVELFKQALDKTTSSSLRKQIGNRLAALDEQA
jgi:hypothetical protein